MATRKQASASGVIDYVALTPTDRLATARDFLRGREADYYRTWLAGSEDDPGFTDRLKPLAEAISRVQDEVAALEKEVPDAPAP